MPLINPGPLSTKKHNLPICRCHGNEHIFEEKKCQKFVHVWSSTFSESFMKIGDYACRAPFAIFWSLHGIALKAFV